MKHRIEDDLRNAIEKGAVLSFLFSSEDFRYSVPPLDFYKGLNDIIRNINSSLIRIRDVFFSEKE